MDTSTMWVAAGATKASELLHARRQLQKSKLSPGIVAGAAGNAIIECGAAQLASENAERRASSSFTALAAAQRFPLRRKGLTTQLGTIARIDQRTATVDTGNGHNWRVGFALLRHVVDV